MNIAVLASAAGGRKTIDIIESELLDVLVGGPCPLLCRSRWKRFRGSLDWNGLLSSVHGIFEAVVPVWRRVLKNISRPPKVEDFKLPDIAQPFSLTGVAKAWDELVDAMDYDAGRGVGEQVFQAEDALATDADGKVNWSAWHAKIGKDVDFFASSHAAPLLGGLSTVIGCMNQSFDRILHLSGVERFDRDFQDIVVKTLPGQ